MASLTPIGFFDDSPLPMASLTPIDSFDDSPPPSSHHHRKKSASERRDDAKLVFNKTIDGHYRHGKTGYRQVGALFLTWEDDDMQCKETEVRTEELVYITSASSHLAIRWTN